MPNELRTSDAFRSVAALPACLCISPGRVGYTSHPFKQAPSVQESKYTPVGLLVAGQLSQHLVLREHWYADAPSPMQDKRQTKGMVILKVSR